MSKVTDLLWGFARAWLFREIRKTRNPALQSKKVVGGFGRQNRMILGRISRFGGVEAAQRARKLGSLRHGH